MYELEGKLHLPDASAGALIERLGRAGIRFGEPVDQIDIVFARSLTALLRPRPGTVIARIRVEHPGHPSLTVKQRRTHELDRAEFEVAIDDPTAGQEALCLLGLHRLVTVKKRRWLASPLQPGVTLTCDDVEGLGVFLEVELLGRTASRTARLAALLEGVRAVLPHDYREVTKGYDRLLVEAKRKVVS